MNRSLGWIAGIGLTLCVVFLGLAFAKGGNDLGWLHKFDGDNWLHSYDAEFAGDKPVAATAEMKQWNWGGDNLEIDIPAEVRVTAPAYGAPAGPASIIVRGAPGILGRVRFANGKLALAGHQRTFNDKEHLEVSIQGRFKQYALAVGDLKLGHIEQDRLTVRISGAGAVSGEGKVNDLDVAISGFGDAKFGNLATDTARVRISGAGDAKIRPSERADITLSGIGNVTLLREPKTLVKHISGLGQVEGPDGDDDDEN